MNKKALGKGLSALIPEGPPLETGLPHSETGVVYLKTEQVRPSPLQPRIDFNQERQKELIASIKEKGFLQPVLVRKKNDGYELIAGERRLRAAKALNIAEIPAIVKTVNDEEAMIISLIENIQREDLNPIEEARAFERLVNDFNFTQDHVAQHVGKDRTTVSNMLRLLKLPLEIQKSISEGIISMGHARALLSLENLSEQIKLFQDIISNQLSVREIESLVKTKTKHKKRTTISTQKDPFVRDIEEVLQRFLSTKVRIVASRKRGKIIIDFYSPQDLERIVGVIKK